MQDKKIGEGTYGCVYQCQEEDLVVKVPSDSEYLAEALREISSLARLKGADNVLQMKRIEKKSPHIFLPKYARTLGDSNNYPMDHATTRKIIFQLLNGLHNLQNRGIYHRDLKPNNILYNPSSNEVVIADFGSSKCCATAYTLTPLEKGSVRFTTGVSTICTTPPEVLYARLTKKKCIWSGAADMWSIGCIIAFVLRQGKYFFIEDTYKEQMAILVCHFGGDYDKTSFLEEYNHVKDDKYFSLSLREKFSKYNPDEKAVDLLSKIFVMDPQKRLCVSEALRHPYFHGLLPSEMTLSSLQCVQRSDKGIFERNSPILRYEDRRDLFINIYNRTDKMQYLSLIFLLFDLYYVKTQKAGLQAITFIYYIVDMLDYGNISPDLSDDGQIKKKDLEEICTIVNAFEGDIFLSTEHSYLLLQEEKYHHQGEELLLVALMSDGIRSFDKATIVEEIICLLKGEPCNQKLLSSMKETWKDFEKFFTSPIKGSFEKDVSKYSIGKYLTS